jgi:uncharacterized protein (TIGR00251 family)
MFRAGPGPGRHTEVACIVMVRLIPRGGRDAIDGIDPAGALRVRVAAPPADGAANRALIGLLADVLHVPATSILIVTGRTSRAKRVRIEGATPADILARWPGADVRPA